MFDDDRPLFQQLADKITAGILSGEYAEGTAVPSINELAAFYRINPATANKAVNLLVALHVIEKRRGIGMFVLAGARQRLLAARRQEFALTYIEPLLNEADRLGISLDELIDLITTHTRQDRDNDHSDRD
ncbi:GntR family transcriptional regulator [Micrococcoides hystricis]|uniref:GntR family transcriptional regulator n=1 Tax=Micrococcoides hystricis TaxID=1572761 RepID=A0ABV6PAE3_9MICC